jgi:hypothetical protein
MLVSRATHWVFCCVLGFVYHDRDTPEIPLPILALHVIALLRQLGLTLSVE